MEHSAHHPLEHLHPVQQPRPQALGEAQAAGLAGLVGVLLLRLGQRQHPALARCRSGPPVKRPPPDNASKEQSFLADSWRLLGMFTVSRTCSRCLQCLLRLLTLLLQPSSAAATTGLASFGVASLPASTPGFGSASSAPALSSTGLFGSAPSSAASPGAALQQS